MRSIKERGDVRERRHWARTIRDEKGLSLWARLAMVAAAWILSVVAASVLDSTAIYVGTSIAIWAILASGLNVSVGYAGQLNLANGAFFALGAYWSVLGTRHYEWTALPVFAVAILSAVIISAIISLLVLRARGLYFALLTAGISIVVDSVLILWSSVTGGSTGLSLAGADFKNPDLDFVIFKLSEPQHYFVAAIWVLTLIVFAITVCSRRGVLFVWTAVRDDEELAASVGIRATAARRSAFIFSSAVAAIAGVLFAHWVGYVSPGTFAFAVASVMPLAMIIIGGSGTMMGPIIGAVIVMGAPEVSRQLESYAVLVFGALLLLVILLAPGGVVGSVRDGLGSLQERRKHGRQVNNA